MQGILLAVFASLCFGTTAIFVRLGLQHIKPSIGTFLSVTASFIVLALLTLIRDHSLILSLSLTAVLWFGLIGVLNYAVARQANYYATKIIGVAKANPIMASAPLFSLVLAVTFLGEAVNVLILLGTICIVSGLMLLVSSK